ncbi:MAG: Sll0314/Alr1548 family TPR repeat-containing protein [Cyanobacteria bacterium P01_A01_bin.45]
MPKVTSRVFATSWRLSSSKIAVLTRKVIALAVITSTLTTTATSIFLTPAFAGDPFRTQKPHQIGDITEAAFKAIFEQGNYKKADEFLDKAIISEADEPLAYAMKASLAYTKSDKSKLEIYAQQTLSSAQKLVKKDKLRGNLYIAVGHFLDGAVILLREGTFKGAPSALKKLRKVYEYLEKAEAESPNDPELNLIKGYMNLMLAVNLPFADPEQAIKDLQTNAAPKHLVNRGIAVAYRDLKNYSKALKYVDLALKEKSENPELQYLKAQILRERAKQKKSQAKMREAVSLFDQALAKKDQLPVSLVKQIERERRKANKNLDTLVSN